MDFAKEFAKLSDNLRSCYDHAKSINKKLYSEKVDDKSVVQDAREVEAALSQLYQVALSLGDDLQQHKAAASKD